MGPTKITQEDQQFNINFVGEVKKYPCLFDSNSSEYKQASKQDKAWTSVSMAVDESIDTCKKRWRNLRCCMTRYLKSIRDSNDLTPNMRRKPYYLYTHMQFVLPYLKVREEGTSFEQDDSTWIKQTTSVTEEMVKTHEDEEEEEEAQELETVDVHEEEHHQQQIKQSIIQSIKILPMGQEAQALDHQQQHESLPSADPTTTTTYEIIAATPSKQPRLANHQSSTGSASPTGTINSPLQTSNDVKKEILGQRQFYTISGTPTHSSNVPMPCYSSTPLPQQQHSTTYAQQTQAQIAQTQAAHHFALIQSAPSMGNDADHNFFQSLIPDIQPMTMDQKRKLKIGILQLIDGILNT